VIGVRDEDKDTESQEREAANEGGTRKSNIQRLFDAQAASMASRLNDSQSFAERKSALEKIMEATLNAAELKQFTGSENWYRHGLAAKMLCTDGVKFLAERAGAYWLIDEIAFAQSIPAVRAQGFQAWKLDLNKSGCGAKLRCEDGNGNNFYTKRIPYTDFPLKTQKIWVENSVIMLPSER
jgi:hypothetical protein